MNPGPIKHSSPAYLTRLEKIIARPLRRKQTAIFIWLIDNAKSFHLPLVSTNFAFLDLSVNPKVVTSTKPLIINELDSLTPEQMQAAVAQLISHQSISQIHVKSEDAAKTILKLPGGLDWIHGIYTIPLPTQKEMEQIIALYSKDYHLNFTPRQVKDFFALCGSRIMLFKAAVRAFIDNPDTKISSIALSKEFELKKQIITESEPPPSVDIDGLTKAEKRIYSVLSSKRGEVISREDLALAIWPEDSFENYSDWAIDKLIQRLREKLILQGFPETAIKTVKGKGYRFTLNPISKPSPLLLPPE